MPNINKIPPFPNIHLINSRKKGEWLCADDKGNLQTVNTWFGKSVFLLCNFLFFNREITRVASAIEQTCRQLEGEIKELDNTKIEGSLTKRLKKYSAAGATVKQIKDGLGRISPKLYKPDCLIQVEQTFEKKLQPFTVQLNDYLKGESNGDYDFTVHDSAHNKSYAKQLQRLQNFIPLIRESPNVTKQEVLKAVSDKVNFAGNSVLKKCSALSATVKTCIPLTNFPEEVQKGKESVMDLQNKLQYVPQNFYNKKQLDHLVHVFNSPEVAEVELALEVGFEPELIPEGLSGSYIMPDRLGEPCGIFKPSAQEIGMPGNPKISTVNTYMTFGVKSGTSYRRERVAYLLDKDHFANVPLTKIVRLAHKNFDRHKKNPVALEGSLQTFVPGCRPIYKAIPVTINTGFSWINSIAKWIFGESGIPTQQLHALAIFDIRVLNCDRHMKNALVDSKNNLYPIDHGLILPDIANKIRFDWMSLPQAREPFSKETLAYIESLDSEKDAAILREQKIDTPAIQRMQIATLLLKECAKAGLTVYQIARLMRGSSKRTSHFESSICYKILAQGMAANQVIKKEIADFLKKH